MAIDASKQLNGFLVDVFHGILRTEEKDLKRRGLHDLSVSEVHVLDAVYRMEEKGTNSARDIALVLGITPASLSAALNVLEKKGYLVRLHDEKDRRRIVIRLTPPGEKAEKAHRLLHEQMVEGVLAGLSSEETSALLNALEKLSHFFG